MKGKLLYTLAMFFALFMGASAQEHLVEVEVKKLPNGEAPTIIINPVDINDKVKSVEVFPFIHGKAKVVMRLESSTSRLSNISLKNSGVVEVTSSHNVDDI